MHDLYGGIIINSILYALQLVTAKQAFRQTQIAVLVSRIVREEQKSCTRISNPFLLLRPMVCRGQP
jgi:hypothetical protein